ncbi:MAG: DUF3810 domain-containing protein [Ruminococcaceae bacterium]|nr:DUF3810 domain-containing protein [Oscillospiraceae bacterium]
MIRVLKKINQYVPTAAMVFALLALVGAMLHIGFIISPRFADIFNFSVSHVLRRGLALLTGWFHFSLAETIVLSAPVILVTVYVICVKKSMRGKRYFIRCIAGILSVLLLVYAGFVFVFAPGYRGGTLDGKLGLEIAVGDDAKSNLFTAMFAVRDRLNALADEVLYDKDGASVRPYSHEEAVQLCVDAYGKVEKEYGFFRNFDSSVKRLVTSDIMTYTHISGMYTFFTGEANLNTNYPYFVNVYTTAHEMAHQRGIARENEANFMAYLACISSDDPYLQYSGYLSMYQYLAPHVSSASKTLYNEAVKGLDERVKGDLAAYSEFFDKYRDSTAAEVSDAVNNTYLVLQGTEGTESYGLVVDLAGAYHAKKK